MNKCAILIGGNMVGFWFITIILIVVTFILSIIFEDPGNDLFGAIVALFWCAYLLVSSFSWLSAEVRNTDNIINSYSETANLISLKDKNQENLSGEFHGSILFTYGSIKTEQKQMYCVMTGDDQNGYLIKKYDAESTYLFLDGDKNPCVVEKYNTIEHSYDGNFIFGKIFKFHKDPKIENILTKRELHIPKNSVQINYSVDLE
jgi:hypothetical protein